MTGLHVLLETSFMREALAKAEAERQGQLAWFESLLSSLNDGDITLCKVAIGAAIAVLRKGDSIKWTGSDNENS